MHGVALDRTQVLVGGRWRSGSGGQTWPVSSPSDGSLLAQIASGTAADVDAAVLRPGTATAS